MGVGGCVKVCKTGFDVELCCMVGKDMGVGKYMGGKLTLTLIDHTHFG